MSYDSGAPWRDGDECPNCGATKTHTGRGGWLLDCRGCGAVSEPEKHPEWAITLRLARGRARRLALEEVSAALGVLLNKAAP